MPTVAVFDGIKIQLYWDDHHPAHFHAEYGEYRAQIAIHNLKVIHGYIPNPQLRKVVKWASSRKGPLLKGWIRCESDLHPGKIA